MKLTRKKRSFYLLSVYKKVARSHTFPLKCTKAIIFGSTFFNQLKRVAKTFSFQKSGKIDVFSFYFLGANRPIKDTKSLKEYTMLMETIWNIKEEKTRIFWEEFFQKKKNAIESNALYLSAVLILKDDFEKWLQIKKFVFVNAISDIKGYLATTATTLKYIATCFHENDQIFTYLNNRTYQRLPHQLLIKALLPEKEKKPFTQFKKHCQGIKLYFCTEKNPIETIIRNEQEYSKEIAKILDEITKNVYNISELEKLLQLIS